MTKRTRPSNVQNSEKLPKILQAERLLVDKLIAEDPRLRAACKQAHYSENGEDSIGENTLQIYRQRLGV